jgi:carboxyl-terminal processing protease
MMLKTPSRTACTLSAGLLLLTLLTVFADRLSATHPNDKKTTELVCEMVQRFHISQRPIDDKISEKLLERFLKYLDPQKMYFTQPDIAVLSKNKLELDDQLKLGNTQFAYDAFDLYLRRVDRQMEVAHKWIDTPHDFTVDESIDIDPDKITFAANETELNDRWRKRIKFELLNLKLDNTAEPGKPDA